MGNRYKGIKLPEWVVQASREKLLEHIQYLMSTRDTYKKQSDAYRYRARKAEKLLEEHGITTENNDKE